MIRIATVRLALAALGTSLALAAPLPRAGS